jgi:putative endopeptidase
MCSPQNNLDCYYNRIKSHCVQSDLDRTQQIIDTDMMTIITQPNDIVPNMYVFYNSLMKSSQDNASNDLLYVFNAINLINSIDSMAVVMAALIQYDVGILAMRTLPMITNSKHLSLNLQQNVLTLGSESLYIESQYSSIRSKYVQFIDTMYISLCSDLSIPPIKDFSNKVMVFETILATNYMKDSLNVDENTRLVSVNDLNSNNDLWARIFHVLNISTANVYTNNIKYLGIINILTLKIGSPTFKYYQCYLMWSFIVDSIGYMNESYQRMYYDFSLELEPKTTPFDLNKSVYSTMTTIMCAQVGYVYVDKVFLHHPTPVIDAVNVLAHNIILSCVDILENSHWLSINTRSYAIKKIRAIRFHIGYSSCMDRLTDMQLNDSSLRNSLMIQKRAFNRYIIAKIDTVRLDRLNCTNDIYPLRCNKDDEDWDIQYAGLGYQMVNAFYDQYQNSVYVLAGIINKPMFDLSQPQAINYGALGAIIGHEIIHAIDIEGSKYGISGDLNNWWNVDDRKLFEFEADKISKHYTSLGSTKSSQTLGEDMADIGGLKIALNAYLKFVEPSLPNNNCNETRKLFFSAWAKLWCHKDDENILGNLSDVHADSSLRINGPMSHIDAFYDIFDVKSQDKMFLSPDLRTKFMS